MLNGCPDLYLLLSPVIFRRVLDPCLTALRFGVLGYNPFYFFVLLDT